MADAGIKRALVIGCAANVWAEVDAALKLFTPDTIYCVKLAGVHWTGGRFVWVTLHPEYMRNKTKKAPESPYCETRAALGLHSDYEIVAPHSNEVGMHGHHEVDRRVSYRWPGMNASASSGIYGAKVAMDDGHDRVVLAGIPMDAKANHFTRGKLWSDCASFTTGLNGALPFLKGKVRSMSGRTKEILGVPDKEWIDGIQP